MNGLRAKRIAARLTLRELSRRSGVAVETMSRIETGKARPQPRTLEKLATALGVDPTELTAPAVTPTTKQEARRTEQETITVPELYPDPRNPDVWRRWDGSEDAWTWKVVLDLKRDGAITAAAVVYRHTRDWSTVARLLDASGWAASAEDFIGEHREEIEDRSRVL